MKAVTHTPLLLPVNCLAMHMTADSEGVFYVGIGKAFLLFDNDLIPFKTMTVQGKEGNHKVDIYSILIYNITIILCAIQEG